MSASNVIVLHEARDVRTLCVQRLARAGFVVQEARSFAEALNDRELAKASLIVCGEPIGPGQDSLEVVNEIRSTAPQALIVFIATHSSEELAVRALRVGIADYIRRPFDLDDLVASVTRIAAKIAQTRTVSQPSEPGWEEALTRPIVGSCPVMQEAKARLLRAGATDSNVLITGDTGTGKELAAKLIHNASSRKTKPLVSINCAAIPDTLLESELFGYEKGAFTGAQWGNLGLLERANGGTLFLDEVAEMSAIAQAKVLRVIETKELSRLGARDSIRVNVRLVAATNQNIESLIREHKFRSDLYFRLNVVRISLPSLRERKQDLPALISHFVQELNRQFGRHVEGFSNASYEHLLGYDWPGNVRELRNLLEAAFVDASPERSIIDLPTECRASNYRHCGEERDRLLSALLSTKWNKSKAAKELRWSRMTLYRKMIKYQIPESAPKRTAHSL